MVYLGSYLKTPGPVDTRSARYSIRPKRINDTRPQSKANARRDRFRTLWEPMNEFEPVSVSHIDTKACSRYNLFLVSIGGVERHQEVFVERLSRDLMGKIMVPRTTVAVDVMVQDAPKLFSLHSQLTYNGASTQLYPRCREPLDVPLV